MSCVDAIAFVRVEGYQSINDASLLAIATKIKIEE